MKLKHLTNPIRKMSEPNAKQACLLCDSATENNLELGEFMTSGTTTVHYYCLLLTSGLLQNGDDKDGILGFLPHDIKQEVARIKRLKCSFCKRNRANIGCCEQRCRRTFHTHCAVTNGCLMEFADPYKSYCPDHIVSIAKKTRHTAQEICTICHESMGKYHPVRSILSPCCKSHWFHKSCLQEFALSAGYYFKCPMCNNTEHFREAVKLKGVYVPDKDAAWELEPNAFSELLDESESCGAITCLCLQGREHETAKNKLIKCYMCGSNSIHRNCWKSLNHSPQYTCPDCILPVQIGTANGGEDSINTIAAIDDDNQPKDSDDDDDDDDDDVDVTLSNSCDASTKIMHTNDASHDEQDNSTTSNNTNAADATSSMIEENTGSAKNVSAMLSDVEIIEQINEPVVISSDDESAPPAPTIAVVNKKRPIEDVSPKNHRKKIRRTLETNTTQSKITSYFCKVSEKPDIKPDVVKISDMGVTQLSNGLVFKCKTEK